MGIKRYKPEEIVTKLRQVEVLIDKEWRVLMLFVSLESQNKLTIAGGSNAVVLGRISSRSCDGSRSKTSGSGALSLI